MKSKTSQQPGKSERVGQLKDIQSKRIPVAGGNQGWGRWKLKPAKVPKDS